MAAQARMYDPAIHPVYVKGMNGGSGSIMGGACDMMKTMKFALRMLPPNIRQSSMNLKRTASRKVPRGPANCWSRVCWRIQKNFILSQSPRRLSSDHEGSRLVGATACEDAY